MFAVFKENIERLRGLIRETVRVLPEERACPCANALAGIQLPITLP